MTLERARYAHGLVAVLAGAALLLQLILVVSGSAVLVEQDPPGLLTRLGRFVSYFTVQSNLLVAVSSLMLAFNPIRRSPGLRVLRLAGLVGIAVTAVVHFLLLRPLLHLDGADWAADKLLHLVVPAVALLVWLVAGPRPAVQSGDIARAMVWPVLWLAWTLVVGEITGWVPYPFLDAASTGWAGVTVACGGVVSLMGLLFGAVALIDRGLHAVPRPASAGR